MIQNGIQFTPDVKTFTPIASESLQQGRVSIDDPKRYQNTNNVNYIINGVAIDWNHAQLPNSSEIGGNKEINTTGELLKLINDMQKEIYTLTAAVIALSNK